MERWIDTFATALQLQVSSETLTARSNGGGVRLQTRSASPPSTLPGFTGAPLNSARGPDAAADSHDVFDGRICAAGCLLPNYA
jgi:hypothetical protein